MGETIPDSIQRLRFVCGVESSHNRAACLELNVLISIAQSRSINSCGSFETEGKVLGTLGDIEKGEMLMHGPNMRPEIDD